MGAKSGSQIGGNIMLASMLAILSYAPFEVVAKGALVFSVVLFVLDPIPPVSRLLALLTTGFVAILSKVHREWQESQQQRGSEEVPSRTDIGDEFSESPHDFVVVDKSEGDEQDIDAATKKES